MEPQIHPITQEDQAWIAKKLTDNWGAPIVVSRGKSYDASKLPGFVASYDGTPVGIVTYRIDSEECELVTLDSWLENIGIGTNLVEAVKGEALKSGCSRLWLITTNDNLHALAFYQKRGFQLIAVHPNAIAESRVIKPTIPVIGMHGIPIRDEVELQILLVDKIL